MAEVVPEVVPEVIPEVVPDINPDLLIQPRFNSLCTTCQWSHNNVELYNWVSEKALKGMPSGHVWKLLVEHMKEKYPDIKPPSRQAVWTHFKKHIPPLESVRIAVEKEHFESGNKDPMINDRVLEEIKKGNFDEYKELCALYIKFRETNDKIYELTAALMAPSRNGVSEYSQNKIQTYVSMVNTQKSILAEIGKMRQGDKLVEVVSKYLMETYTKSIVARLTEEFAALASVLQRQGVSQQILDAYNEITHGRLAKIILDEASNAMSLAKKEFKLPLN